MDLHDSLCDLLHVLLRGNALQIRIHNFTEIEYMVNQLHITMIRNIFLLPSLVKNITDMEEDVSL